MMQFQAKMKEVNGSKTKKRKVKKLAKDEVQWLTSYKSYTSLTSSPATSSSRPLLLEENGH